MEIRTTSLVEDTGHMVRGTYGTRNIWYAQRFLSVILLLLCIHAKPGTRREKLKEALTFPSNMLLERLKLPHGARSTLTIV